MGRVGSASPTLGRYGRNQRRGMTMRLGRVERAAASGAEFEEGQGRVVAVGCSCKELVEVSIPTYRTLLALE